MSNLTHNGLAIPEMMQTDRILSAFCNPLDTAKLQEYEERIRYSEEYIPYSIPPILGFPDVITEDDVDSEKVFLSGDPVTGAHIGILVWYVTDGHHRSCAAINAGLPFLLTEVDPSTFVNEEELLAWRA